MDPHTLWISAAACLTPRSPGLGPCTPRMSVAPCPDPWEPRAGPLHPMDTCSPLPAPLGVGQEWAPTPGRVLQLPHQQLRGSGWLPLGPTAPSPPGAGHGVDLPFVVLEAPHPHRGVCTTCTTCLIPVGVCHLRPPSVLSGLDEGLCHPSPPRWWDRLMAWAPGPPPPGLSALWACTCPRSPPPWTRGAPHADRLHQSLTPPGTAIASHGLSLGVTHRTLAGCRGAESSSFWETAAPPPQ